MCIRDSAGLTPVAHGAGHRAVGPWQVGDGALGEDLETGLSVSVLDEVVLLERDDLLLQGADQLETGAIAHVGESRVLVPTEVALTDPSVFRAVEQRAVGLELPDAVRGLLGVKLRHARVVEELATAHGVAEVDLPVVLGVDVSHGRGDTALRHDLSLIHISEPT